MNNRQRMAFLLGLGILLGGVPASGQGGFAPVTLLSINDVYRLDHLAGVRTLRRQLEARHGQVLLLHAGDFLFPSLLSRRYQGRQMIDLMNRLDGDPEAWDPWMFVTFGNHEFDLGALEDRKPLNARMSESQFAWVTSNIVFARDSEGQPVVGGEALQAWRLIDLQGTRIGLFGLTIANRHPAYVERFADYMETARAMSAQLRQAGADLVIALTHLTMELDHNLLEQLGDAGPDLILGGHEHHRQVARVGERLVIKADADAASVAVVRILPRPGAPPLIKHRFQEIPGQLAGDPEVAARAAWWEARFEDDYCTEQQLGPACLSTPIGRTQIELVAEELTIRRFATNLGDWVADQALAAFREQGAQIAFINAGSLRLNRNLPAGHRITRKTLDELFTYPNRLALIRLTGAQLRQVIAHAVEDWTGSGHWLQISGFRFRQDPSREKAGGLRLVTPDGERPVRDDESILAVTSRYLIDDQGDQDGYRMLGPGMRVHPEGPELRLRDLVVAALQAAEPEGIAPVEDGRICNLSFPDETCPAAEWKPEEAPCASGPAVGTGGASGGQAPPADTPRPRPSPAHAPENDPDPESAPGVR